MGQRPDCFTRPGRHVPADVLAWRSDVLQHAGCEPGLAWQLAADGSVDLHDFLNLIDRGCPPELAARILAPLDPSRHNPGN